MYNKQHHWYSPPPNLLDFFLSVCILKMQCLKFQVKHNFYDSIANNTLHLEFSRSSTLLIWLTLDKKKSLFLFWMLFCKFFLFFSALCYADHFLFRSPPPSLSQDQLTFQIKQIFLLFWQLTNPVIHAPLPNREGLLWVMRKIPPLEGNQN